MTDWYCLDHNRPLTGEPQSLSCSAGHSIPVVGGIPRFVSGSTYADAFGVQWNRYRRTQLDSYSGSTITMERLRRCLGSRLWDALPGLEVLECGCGAGRFTEILLARGARVTSIDLSDAVEANRDNFPISDHHRVAQADIMALPFAPGQFDIVLCLGVIQHTQSSEESIAALAAHVRPGGALVIDHYRPTLSWYTKTAPLFRAVLRHLPAAAGIRWTERLVTWLLPLHKRAARSKVIHGLLTRVSPVLSYYRGYPQLDERMHREWALLDTHDSLTAWHHRVRTSSQIRAALERAGLVDIWCERGGNGIEARATRP